MHARGTLGRLPLLPAAGGLLPHHAQVGTSEVCKRLLQRCLENCAFLVRMATGLALIYCRDGGRGHTNREGPHQSTSRARPWNRVGSVNVMRRTRDLGTRDLLCSLQAERPGHRFPETQFPYLYDENNNLSYLTGSLQRLICN